MLNRLKALFRFGPFNRAPSSMAMPVSASDQATYEVATFAGGCFWGVEHIFLKHFPPSENKGIIKTTVGYTGGREASEANYDDVCTGTTDHAEALRIEFDPKLVSYAALVEFFYRTHDPTTVDKQGHDRGSQYRSAIFYNSPGQKNTAQTVTDEVQKAHFDPHGKTIVTQIVEAKEWFDAEDNHQDYLTENPTGYQCPTHKLHW